MSIFHAIRLVVTYQAWSVMHSMYHRMLKSQTHRDMDSVSTSFILVAVVAARGVVVAVGVVGAIAAVVCVMGCACQQAGQQAA